MDSTDEEFYGSTSFTTKGRRTKRQRTTTAATSSYGGGIENSYGSSGSATPDENDIISEATTTTEEEEEMANCLILLAQGGTVQKTSKPSKIGININNGLYECKTCNRTFHSFQALGGHRTSHKKVVKQPSVATSIIITPRPPKPDEAKTSRIHECSICGSEFPSGQALGGHMRRHRPSLAPIVHHTAAATDLGGSKNVLSLDLNLPAPHDLDDEIVDHNSSIQMLETTKFHVLPTPALLDCHY